MTRPLLVLVLALCVTPIGCGGPSPIEPDATSPDAGVPDARLPLDAASVDGGGGVDGGGPLQFTERYGEILLEQYSARAGDHFGIVSAEFADVSAAPMLDIVDTEGGGCFLRVELSDFSRDYSSFRVSGGDVTISSDGASEVISLPVSGASYRPFYLDAPRWTVGETLTVHTSGGAAPAIDASLVVPQPVTFSVPAMPPPTDRVHIRREAPYTLSWTAVPDGLAYVRFSQSTVSAGMRRVMSLVCTFPASAGTATLPVEVMRSLTMLPGTITFVSVGGLAQTRMNVGGYDIHASIAMTSLNTSVAIE